MFIKQLLTGDRDYEKSLRQRRWAAVGLLAIGLVGHVCYFLLVPDSGLSAYAQGCYLGGASGITIMALILLIRTQYLITHPQAQRKAKIQENDERQLCIDHTAERFAGKVTLFATSAAIFVAAPLNKGAFYALMAVEIIYIFTHNMARSWLSKKL